MTIVPLGPQEPSPGIDRALALARKAVISDVEYDLHFVLAPDATAVNGEAWIRFRLLGEDDPADPEVDVVLDFAGGELSELAVNDRECDPRRVHDHLVLPRDHLVRGLNGVVAKFASKVAPTGTPLTVYEDATDGREYYYTLLVPADAHRLFPCFDQPDLRARCRITLDLPPDWVAVANTLPVAEGVEAIDSGRRWRFAASEPLPTYLMAFACGPFAIVEGPVPPVAGIDNAPLRIFVRPSEVEHLDVDAVVALHSRGLAWLEQTFGVPYPFGKLDLVLCPGFPYGGMEHAGAIFYRESAIAFDHPPTAAELVRRSTLVYHELSHQWFGNLVTMKWFDDLWLKEGFATFIGYRALEALEPDRRAWLRFLQRVKPRAYEVDGTPGTTPVYQELQNLADAKSAYGAIVYNKAPAVLRELCDRLGTAVFDRGLQRFLTDHAFGNADWRDLAAALEGASRQDLGRWSERWLLAPSMPQVRIDWQVDDAGNVTAAALVQRPTAGGEATWPLRLELLLFDDVATTRTLTLASDAARTEIDAMIGKRAPAAVLANPADVAYGQFVPDARSAAWLAANAARITDPLVRAVALSNLFEAVREAELDPATFAATALDVVAIETDPDTHGWLLGELGTCLLRYLSPERAAPLRARATELLLGQLAGEPSGRELTTFRFLARASTDPRVFELCRSVARADGMPAGLLPGKEDRFLAAAALLAAGEEDGELDALATAFAGEDVAKERFLARAATPTAATKAEYWQHTSSSRSRPSSGRRRAWRGSTGRARRS
ncbi:MAG: ERAP1-like C-terminal domain-containing protein [Planctomycetes bacterium]|nr:ERAP1-like C-terminal domain-containing protein [Planctomycetota bacterium]